MSIRIVLKTLYRLRKIYFSRPYIIVILVMLSYFSAVQYLIIQLGESQNSQSINFLSFVISILFLHNYDYEKLRGIHSRFIANGTSVRKLFFEKQVEILFLTLFAVVFQIFLSIGFHLMGLIDYIDVDTFLRILLSCFFIQNFLLLFYILFQNIFLSVFAYFFLKFIELIIERNFLEYSSYLPIKSVQKVSFIDLQADILALSYCFALSIIVHFAFQKKDRWD